MGEVVNGSREIVIKVTKNDLEAVDRLLMGSISKLNDKLEELEDINRSMQAGYISRLQRIVETRKEAEAKFLEERQLFTRIVRDLEIAYQQKQEAFQSRLKKELVLTKNAYDKLKDDNGSRCELITELLMVQLGNAQTMINELSNKLRAKDELLKMKVTEAKHEYTRLMEEVSSSVQDQGARIIQKIEGLSNYFLTKDRV